MGPAGFRATKGLPVRVDGAVRGTYQVTVSRDGYVAVKAQADVKAGEVATVSVKLHRQEVAPAADASAKSRLQVEAMPTYNGDPNRFTAAAGVVTDKRMGIAWQRGDSAKRYDWSGAKAYCRGMQLGGQGAWRLPTVAELVSTIDRTQSAGMKIAAVFQTTDARYWSGTPWELVGSAWYVYFDRGDAANSDVTYPLRVRCVR